MTIQSSVAVRTALGNALIATIGTSPKVQIYSGTQPATCATASSGTLLTTFSLGSTWATVTSGVLTFSSTPVASTAVATGTAGYYRIMDTALANCHEQGTVGTSGTDLIIDNASIVSGQTVNITSWTKTYPGA